MNVSVEFTGQLRTAMGHANDWVELPEGATVAMLLVQLGQRCGEAARTHLLNASKQPQPSLLVAINGTAFPSRQAASTVLSEGDTVVLLPPIAGG
ncbi:MAG TPA: MoaD/ThiS family protein [Pirellulales bacterium]|nr:MoaD/ThiS family protein [Pirellulales bacterium]